MSYAKTQQARYFWPICTNNFTLCYNYVIFGATAVMYQSSGKKRPPSARGGGPADSVPTAPGKIDSARRAQALGAPPCAWRSIAPACSTLKPRLVAVCVNAERSAASMTLSAQKWVNRAA